jgi:hypothetical protein
VIANPNLLAVATFCLIGLLLSLNLIFRFPDFGTVIEQFNQFWLRPWTIEVAAVVSSAFALISAPPPWPLWRQRACLAWPRRQNALASTAAINLAGRVNYFNGLADARYIRPAASPSFLYRILWRWRDHSSAISALTVASDNVLLSF